MGNDIGTEIDSPPIESVIKIDGRGFNHSPTAQLGISGGGLFLEKVTEPFEPGTEVGVFAQQMADKYPKAVSFNIGNRVKGKETDRQGKVIAEIDLFVGNSGDGTYYIGARVLSDGEIQQAIKDGSIKADIIESSRNNHPDKQWLIDRRGGYHLFDPSKDHIVDVSEKTSEE